MRPLPTVHDVLARLGDLPAARSEVDAMMGRSLSRARTYTRGSGFEDEGRAVEADLASVVVESVVRTLVNPELALATSQPPFGAIPGTFGEWTLEELRVLERYRVRQSSD